MIKNVLLKVGLGIAMFYIMLYMSSIEMTIDAPVFGVSDTRVNAHGPDESCGNLFKARICSEGGVCGQEGGLPCMCR